MVIWADTLPVSQLGYFRLPLSSLRPFLEVVMQLGLDTSYLIPHFVFCRYMIIMGIKSVTLTLGLKTQTASRQR